MTHTAKRALVVLKDGKRIGVIGDGPGPFQSAGRWHLPDPVLPHLRYTSHAIEHEHALSFVVRDSPDLDAALSKLLELGYSTSPVAWESAFAR